MQRKQPAKLPLPRPSSHLLRDPISRIYPPVSNPTALHIHPTEDKFRELMRYTHSYCPFPSLLSLDDLLLKLPGTSVTYFAVLSNIIMPQGV